MFVEMHAGLASEWESKLKMITSYVDKSPTALESKRKATSSGYNTCKRESSEYFLNMKSFAVAVILAMLLAVIEGCPAQGTSCKECIVDRMENGCPSCVPVLRCMTRCLWIGNSRSHCANKCNANDGKPTLTECRNCMSACKCSCVSSM